jgi:hypothetical protein
MHPAGGGERYLLSAAAVIQALNFTLHLILQDDNSCKDAACVSKIANALRIPLNVATMEIKIVKLGWRDKAIPSHGVPYELFFAMGNEKFPEFISMGSKYNIFMCQFPFDMAQKMTDGQLLIMSSYQQGRSVAVISHT